MSISVSLHGCEGFAERKEIFALQPEVERCHHALHNKTGKGNDFVGCRKPMTKRNSPALNKLRKKSAQTARF